MRSSRRAFLSTILAAGASAGLPRDLLAQAAEELKLATFVPPTHIILARVLTPWAQELPGKSGNKLSVRMFPSMQLGGSPPQLYRQMTQGISDICFTLPGYTSGDFPMMALTELPGTATSAEDGTRKLWANFDRFLAREYKDAKVLMLWNSDTASLMSKSKPIRTLEDMKGLKIRTPSAAQSAQLEALGATPIDMPANQIYNNLDRGVVDAAMIPMSAALDFKLIEVARYFTLNAPLGRSPFLVAMNRNRYEKLPADLRKVLDDTTGLSLSLKGAATYDHQNHEAIEAAKKDRETILLPEAERQRWVAAFRPLIRQKVEEGEKAGLPARGLISAYGLIS
ncbi:MAG: TRAP transporter substrate-binding protein [Alphaproteobacteria bacterium]|nr:TRAP transporter substrate-binding protein [Alphaproteobacteria bacterium]